MYKKIENTKYNFLILIVILKKALSYIKDL